MYQIGEIISNGKDVILNEGRRTQELIVSNLGDRAIQVGSHYHFFEVNKALRFDREKAFGMHLDIPAGTAVRFEPGGREKGNGRRICRRPHYERIQRADKWTGGTGRSKRGSDPAGNRKRLYIVGGRWIWRTE